MTYNTRKRRRTEAFPEKERTEQSAEGEELRPSGTDAQPPENATGGEQKDLPEQLDEKAEKKQEIWDAFREENYEVLEQLPLSLHRSFALILELDQQVHDNEDKLLPALHQYITLRKTLMNVQGHVNRGSSLLTGDSSNVQAPPLEGMVTDAATSSQDVVLPSTPGSATILSTPGISTKSSSASSSEPDTALSSRQLLTKVAQLSEEIVRAADEKVNVARFAYDLVDRYIRDLDRAIKEQETSISLGLRPGTHPAYITLPEVVVPSGVRAARIMHSAMPAPPPVEEAGTREANTGDSGEVTLGMVSADATAFREKATPMRPRRKPRVAKWSKKKKNTAKPVDADHAEVSVPSGLKLTVPPLASVSLNVDSAETRDNPNEPRYCYCNQISYGEMIACDNPKCEREWFHLGCAGLTQAPGEKVKWYCRDCSEAMGIGSQRKAR